MADKRNIFFAVPSYSGHIHYSTHLSIVRALGEVTQRGWLAEEVFRTADSVISRARNVLFSMFLASNCTDLFYWDSDVSCRPGCFVRLMEHPVDIVGGAYRGRSDAENFVMRTLPSGIMQFDPATKLMEVDAIGTGFLRITRAAAERVRDAFYDDWYHDATAPEGMKIHNIFDFQLRGREYWSEDYTFCRRARQVGLKIWVDPLLELDHLGEKLYRGCLFDWLQKNAPRESGAAPQQPPALIDLAKAFLKAGEPAKAAA